MKDAYPIKVHQSPLMTDLTFVQPTIIRPGSLRPQRLAAQDSARSNRYISRERLKRTGPVQPTVVLRPSRAYRPAAQLRRAPEVRPRPTLIASVISTISAYGHAVRRLNWRVLFADKHKLYTADKGLKLRPVTFRTQTGALIVASVLLLGTAQTMAPSSPETKKPADSPLTVTYPAQFTGNLTPDRSQNESQKPQDGSTNSASSPAVNRAPAAVTTNSGSTPAAPLTPSVPIVPVPATPDPVPVVTVPVLPVETPVIDPLPNPLPMNDGGPNPSPDSNPDTTPVQTVVDGVTDVTHNLTDSLTQIL